MNHVLASYTFIDPDDPNDPKRSDVSVWMEHDSAGKRTIEVFDSEYGYGSGSHHFLFKAGWNDGKPVSENKIISLTLRKINSTINKWRMEKLIFGRRMTHEERNEIDEKIGRMRHTRSVIRRNVRDLQAEFEEDRDRAMTLKIARLG